MRIIVNWEGPQGSAVWLLVCMLVRQGNEAKGQRGRKRIRMRKDALYYSILLNNIRPILNESLCTSSHVPCWRKKGCVHSAPQQPPNNPAPCDLKLSLRTYPLSLHLRNSSRRNKRTNFSFLRNSLDRKNPILLELIRKSHEYKIETTSCRFLGKHHKIAYWYLRETYSKIPPEHKWNWKPSLRMGRNRDTC